MDNQVERILKSAVVSYSDSYLHALRKTTKILVRIACVPASITKTELESRELLLRRSAR
jgi:hypothetical protein